MSNTQTLVNPNLTSLTVGTNSFDPNHKLTGLHPDLLNKAIMLGKAMEDLGFPMVVVQGLRTAEYQNSLFQQGRTKPGPIVTNCDGVKEKSNHQAAADGMGHAADIAFLVNGQPSFDIKFPWACYGACAKAIGLRWGGDFRLVDLDHVELP